MSQPRWSKDVKISKVNDKFDVVISFLDDPSHVAQQWHLTDVTFEDVTEFIKQKDAEFEKKGDKHE